MCHLCLAADKNLLGGSVDQLAVASKQGFNTPKLTAVVGTALSHARGTVSLL